MSATLGAGGAERTRRLCDILTDVRGLRHKKGAMGEQDNDLMATGTLKIFFIVFASSRLPAQLDSYACERKPLRGIWMETWRKS